MKKIKGKWLLVTGLVATVALAAAGDRFIRNEDSVITLKKDGAIISSDGIGSTDASTASPTIAVGETITRSNLDIGTGTTWTVEGELLTTGELTGVGELTGTGEVNSLDNGTNGETEVGRAHV